MKAKAIMADTHPAEYLIHKYWARKPSNILREYISAHFKDSELLVDPFCGSGVFLAEAKKQELNVIGCDVNPIAYLLSEVTSNPPAIKEFISELNNLLVFADKFRDLYKTDGKEIRYLVHRMESECSKCGEIGSIEQSIKKGNKYYCQQCEERLSFNFEKALGTKITKIFTRDNVEYTDQKSIREQEKILQNIPNVKEDVDLVTNRRILAFPGMRLSDLFTARAYYILSQLFERAHKIKGKAVRNAVLLLLTSSVAQSSRLIPYRNNLSTGGPAWTVPGFWIAPIHLETNPIIHLHARHKKLVKGIESLRKAYEGKNSKVSVYNKSAKKTLEELADESIDGIFFDPPYGDNVPYVEFSAIWNGFLKKATNYDEEIIVSDRKEHKSSWDEYSKNINDIISLFEKKLKKNGKVVMTFNNLDPRAWKVVLDSFSKASFVCIEAKYQIPAVVSSKSQTASKTSYVGDYYCVFKKGNQRNKPSRDLYYLTDTARKVILSREGLAPKNLVHRVVILTILNNGMNTDFLDKFEEVLKPIATQDNEHYYIREELNKQRDTETLGDVLQKLANDSLKDGKKTVREFYEEILETTSEIGAPSLSEVRDALKGMVLFDKNNVYLQSKSATQNLFS